MKKVLFALCAVSLLAFSACKKDNVEPENTTSTQTNNNQNGDNDQIPSGEGYYNPGARIMEIKVDGETAQLWDWTNGLLMSIREADSNGNMTNANTFTYDNKRLSTATMSMMDMPITASYTYQGNLLSTMGAAMGPMIVGNIVYDHNADNKIDHMKVNINEQVLGMLGQLLGSGLLGNIGNLFGKGPQQKMNLTGSNIDVYMQWQGNNVSRQRVSAEIEGSITVGEIRQFVNVDSLPSSVPSIVRILINAMNDSVSVPATIVLYDTIDMTYDENPNPFCGFLGRLEPSAYSANNVMTSRNAASAKVTFNVGSYELPFPLDLPIGGTFTYTYDAAGYPETVTNGDGSVMKYIYQ